MSIIQDDIPGSRVLDLFAGSGALGLEALSRGARSATFVELAPRSIAALRANIATLGAANQSTVHRADALAFARKLGAGDFEVAFADPPYRLGLAERVARLWLDTPFARVLGIEHEKGIELPDASDSRSYGDTVVTFYRSG